MLKSVAKSGFFRHAVLPSRCLHEASKKLDVNEVQEIKIPVPWGHVAGKWWGRTDVKPLLGLHGWQDNANTWDTLAPLLPSDISILALDAPGHGLSSPLPQGIPYRFTDQIFVLRYVINHFRWDKVSFLAHSMGAVQSFVYAAIYPDKVENLILCEAFKPLSIDPVKDVIGQAKIFDSYLEVENVDDSSKRLYNYEEAIQRLYEGMVANSLTKESCAVLLKRGAEKIGDLYGFTRDRRVKVGRLNGWLHEYVLYMASRISCNVLLIKGNPGIVFESPKVNKETLEVIKKSAKVFEFHIVEGMHHVHLNNPERVAPIVINFLKNPTPTDSSLDSLQLSNKRETGKFM